MGTGVPPERIRACNGLGPDPSGGFVLYWVVAARRTGFNFSLERAVEWALKLDKPLLVFEALRCDYPWASDRFHRFIIEGMADNQRSLRGSKAGYFPFVERERGGGKGLLKALSESACLVVTDDFPCFFIPRMVETAAERVSVLMEAVDANGILPMGDAGAVFQTAHSFRRFLQKNLRGHLLRFPEEDPLAGKPLRPFAGLPSNIVAKWPAADLRPLLESSGLRALPIDHDVPPSPSKGGPDAARAVLEGFAKEKLARYDQDRNRPGLEATSGLSPYLHFGHVSAHQIFEAIAESEGWNPGRLSPDGRGNRSGWWGMSASAEAFLDQLVTWRELGFNRCRFDPLFDRYASLPAWSRTTLEAHASDRREHLYPREAFEAAASHDAVWNAAQRQLLREGRIHNYLRMLWGKKILEWSPGPREALDTMVALNDKYALDGRDPNSTSGIFWVMGRYDRPWGPARPIFGTVRYMSSRNTARKYDVKPYLQRYSE